MPVPVEDRVLKEVNWQRPNAKSINTKFYKDKSQWNITHDQTS